MYTLWEALNKAKSLRWIELSHPLDNTSPYWAGIPDGSVELGKVVYDWGNPMLDCLIQTFQFPGQFGTHIAVSYTHLREQRGRGPAVQSRRLHHLQGPDGLRL